METVCSGVTWARRDDMGAAGMRQDGIWTKRLSIRTYGMYHYRFSNTKGSIFKYYLPTEGRKKKHTQNTLPQCITYLRANVRDSGEALDFNCKNQVSVYHLKALLFFFF